MLNKVKSACGGKKLIYVLVFLAFASLANAQWVQMSNGVSSSECVTVLATSNANLYAGTAATPGKGVYSSSNYAANWTQTTQSTTTVMSMTASGNFVISGGLFSGVMVSSNNGTSWIQSSLTSQTIYSLVYHNTAVFAGTQGVGIYTSINNGLNWVQTSFPTGKNVRCIFSAGGKIFAGVDNYPLGVGGVWLSTNNGQNWIQSSLNNFTVYSLAAINNYIFAGTYNNGVYVSSNSGVNWSQSGLTNPTTVLSLAVFNNYVFAGTTGGGSIFRSSNNGVNWTTKNEGMGYSKSVNALLVTSTYIFAGTNSDAIYRRDLSNIIGIQNISTEIPSAYSLSQNYPNPFNSTSNFKFEIANLGNVKIVVYDAMGREVETLVNERLQPGTYETQWNASNYPSGVYFYKIQVRHGGSSTNDFSETKRMLMIK